MIRPASDPARYLAGGQPQSVVVPARVARFLDRVIGSHRVDVRGADAELDAVLAAVHIAGLQHLEHGTAALTAVSGSDPLPEPAGRPRSAHAQGAEPLLDAAAVARRLGCQVRNVRDLAARGRLRGDCVSGRWLFTPEAIDAFLANRAS